MVADKLSLFFRPFVFDLNQIDSSLLILMLIPLLSTFLYILFNQVRNTKIKIFRKLFYISASKSKTNAIQIGGFPFGIMTLFGLGYASTKLVSHFYSSELKILYAWMIASLVVVAYGYLDDRYEIKPTVKLASQGMVIFIFSYSVSNIIYPANSAFSFILLSFTSLAVFNGVNLLDGLDTLAFKLAYSTYFSFIVMGILQGSVMVVIVGGVCMGSLLGFYFFNRYPSKMHLGEVGSVFLAFTFVLLFSLLLNSCNHEPSDGIKRPYALFIFSLPMQIYIGELGISFLRRIYNKKSPFRGDKLHAHYLLTEKYGISISSVGTLYGVFQFLFCIGGIFLGLATNEVLTSLFCAIVITLCFSLLGKEYWVGKKAISISLKVMVKSLLKKKVDMIHTSVFDDIEIEVVKKNNNSDEITVNIKDKNDRPKKKRSA